MRACPTCGEDNLEGARFCSGCATPLDVHGDRAERKVVTALFCDLVGSTTLGETHDPEVLEPLFAAYFREARAAIERHGGRVEKYIGDAVAAVFGVPVTHEDDALRAVRAAADIQASVRRLRDGSTIRLSCRIGLSTGEVLMTSATGSPVGDVMNTAARLQAAAEADGVLMGEPTYRMVRDAVRAEPIDAVEARGKRQPVSAYRLVEVTAGAPGVARHLDSTFVGRERERRLLADALGRAVEDRSVQLLTLIGDAGIGKTRLVEEFMASAGAEVAVVRGRCLAYGDGITFWPVAEIVRTAAGILEGDAVGVAREKIAALLPDGPDRAAIVERVTELLGLGATPNPDETFWAVRRLLEALAAERPVVCVIEDLHWAEPRLLDLVDHVVDWSRGGPILLLCDARPEFLERRPGWAGGKMNATTALLRPLSTAEVQELIANLLGRSGLADAVVARVVEAAEGNPLFVEQLLAMLADQGVLRYGDGRWSAVAEATLVLVPPTIQALLGARLDGLDPSERRLLEAAAVEGRTFHVGTVAALCDVPLPETAALLGGLVRKELLRPDQAAIEGDEAYRFRHILITDAAYRAIPKRTRADLHERFADHLEARLGVRVSEYLEILGHHLGRAASLRAELGLPDTHDLARRAADRLASAAQRAVGRGDASSAVHLLERAISLVPSSRDRFAWVPELSWAMQEIGRWNDAADLLRSSLASTSEAEVGLDWHRMRVEQINVEIDFAGTPESQTVALAACAAAAIAAEAAGNDSALARALACRGNILASCQPTDFAAALEAYRLAREAAIRSGDIRTIADVENWLGGMYSWGSFTIDEAARWCDQDSYALTVLNDRLLGAYADSNVYARQRAYRGEFPEARLILERGAASFADLGSAIGWLTTMYIRADVELMAGDRVAFASCIGEILARLDDLQRASPGALPLFPGWLADLFALSGDPDAADAWLARVPDSEFQAAERCRAGAARVRVGLLRGRIGEALEDARAGLAAERGTDMLEPWAYLLDAAAAAFEAAAVPDELRSTLGELADAYRRKGNLVGLGRTERRLAAVD